jgi:hypothetical protein
MARTRKNKISTSQRISHFVDWLKTLKNDPLKTSAHGAKSYGK